MNNAIDVLRLSLNDQLLWLKGKGCYPVISRRGQVWRAHINGAGNQWSEGNTPLKALSKAIRQWIKSGMIIDGYGAMRE